MLNRTIAFMFLAVSILSSSCKNESVEISDQSYFLRGVVRDSTSSTPINGVTVGYRNPSVPDTVLFRGDSLNLAVPNAVLGIAISQGAGVFEYAWFLGNRDTTLYKFLFAYKRGYKFWRYDKHPVTVISLNSYTDQVELKLRVE